MKPSTRAFVALWAANAVLCVSAGYVVGSRARSHASPCSASRVTTSRTVTATPTAAATPTTAAPTPSTPSTRSTPTTPSAPSILEGATPWSEPSRSGPHRRANDDRFETGDRITRRGAAREPLQHTRWLGRAPHVPLVASTEERTLDYVGENSCIPWATRGARWRSVDAWGQFAGRATTTGRDGYAVTNCYELELSITEGTAGTGLYVNEDSPWTPPTSAQFVPSAEQRSALDRMLSQYDSLQVRRFTIDGVAQRDERRVMFFHAHDANGYDRPYAVIGGRSLLIARFDDGAWLLVYQQHSTIHAGPSAFALVAVFDMDRDGTPEIIVHHDEFDGGWVDAIYRSDDHGSSWSSSFESVGGSTA